MDELVNSTRDQGNRPTVVALARQLGMSHSTFWRHFPDIANELVAVARGPASCSQEPLAANGRFDKLTAAHTKLKRSHAEITHRLELATAVIQRLSLDNDRLRQQLEIAAQVPTLTERRGTNPSR